MPTYYLYVHVPFCRRACSYCDFYFTVSEKNTKRFVAAVIREMEMRAGGEAASLYLGGGTPSRLPPEDLARMVEAAKKYFVFHPEAEITLEVNPEDVVDPSAWKDAGINRVSLGVQSFDDAELERMNRVHTGETARTALAAVASVFGNYSLDLIYATPTLSDAVWTQTLEYVWELAPPHFSAYALTVEERTRLAKDVERGKVKPADEETFRRQFYLLADAAAREGYEHYEISNFARPGFRAVHNSAYWHSKPYWGFGPSAHSYDGRRQRTANVRNLDEYLTDVESGRLPVEFAETLSDADLHNEFVLTRLRTDEGIALDQYREKFGRMPSPEPIAKGWAEMVAGRMRLTREGMAFADAAAVMLFV
jgi:oxygen-independent coproporphyrinogen-3 oxidase